MLDDIFRHNLMSYTSYWAPFLENKFDEKLLSKLKNTFSIRKAYIYKLSEIH